MKAVIRFADQFQMFPDGGIVLAAVSGGADSMCLLHLLCSLARESGFSVACAHYNHRLRGADSDEDAAFVRSYCEGAGIPFYLGSGDVRAAARADRRGLEETARDMRYAFLQETAQKLGGAIIATAHTADDNGETLLMRLARGTGLQGLCGIPPVRGNIIRPLLETTRAEVEAYLRENGIPHREDASNQDDAFTRNRLRRHVMPALKALTPAFPKNISVTTRLLREDEAYLSDLADRFLSENLREERRLPAAKLSALPFPISSRVVRKLCGAVSAVQVDAVLALCQSPSPSAEAHLPGRRVYREYGDICFGAPRQAGTFAPVRLSAGETVVLPVLGLKISCLLANSGENVHNSFNTFLFDCDKIRGIITLRPRIPGDRIRLCGTGCTKSLKKLFIEKKIPAFRRERIPVIADEAGVLAVYGIGTDQRAAPKAGCPVLKIVFEEII